MEHDHMTTGDLIVALTARDDLTELEHVLLDRLIRMAQAMADA